MQEEKGKSKSNLASKSMGGINRTKSVRSVASMKFSRMGLRRQSFGYRGVAGIRSVTKKNSEIGIEFRRPLLTYLNTYQLEPRVKFHVASVTKAIEEILDEEFTGHKYNMQESPALALRLAGEIMRQVKNMNFDRYRIISVITLAQKRSQSYNNALTFLWDHERDNYVDIHREVPSAFIQVTVLGIYLD